jgi:hypothetical protein
MWLPLIEYWHRRRVLDLVIKLASSDSDVLFVPQ